MTHPREFVDQLTDESGALTTTGKTLAWAVFALLFIAVIAALAGFGMVVAAITVVLMLGVGLGVLAYTAKMHS